MTFPPADLFQQLLQAGSADWQAQGVMRMSASRRGKDEIFMTPLNGVYMDKDCAGNGRCADD
jgi:hypothetical protein